MFSNSAIIGATVSGAASSASIDGGTASGAMAKKPLILRHVVIGKIKKTGLAFPN
jgi:hypothetical protein